MINKTFESYTKSSAFTLTLSKRMIIVLLSFAGEKADERLNLAPYHALQRRGLLTHVKNRGFVVTEVGELVTQLLQKANY